MVCRQAYLLKIHTPCHASLTTHLLGCSIPPCEALYKDFQYIDMVAWHGIWIFSIMHADMACMHACILKTYTLCHFSNNIHALSSSGIFSRFCSIFFCTKLHVLLASGWYEKPRKLPKSAIREDRGISNASQMLNNSQSREDLENFADCRNFQDLENLRKFDFLRNLKILGKPMIRDHIST